MYYTVLSFSEPQINQESVFVSDSENGTVSSKDCKRTDLWKSKNEKKQYYAKAVIFVPPMWTCGFILNL